MTKHLPWREDSSLVPEERFQIRLNLRSCLIVVQHDDHVLRKLLVSWTLQLLHLLRYQLLHRGDG